jgi:catechol 2,3-dioxygenase-like lactoylglutathione lyase family enzyme
MGAAQQVRRLAGVRVGVPDPASTAGFLRDGLGFACAEADGGGAWHVLCAGDYGPQGQLAIELVAHERLELLRVRFAVGAGDSVEAVVAALDAAGVAHEAAADGAVHFADPAGNPLSVEPATAALVPLPAPGALRPRRLGHLNLKAPSAPAAAAFYQDVLGMRLSEQIGEALFFLRLGSEHHNLGIRPGGAGELHHLGFEVDGWHLYQPFLDRLAAMGVQVEYGPGRHTPGNNIFTYVRDPHSGLRIELFADMGHIADEASHQPHRWDAGDRMSKTINRWGPTPPESFLA